MGPFEPAIGIAKVLGADIIGVGEPEGSKDDKRGIGCFGPGIVAVEILRDLAGGGLGKNKLSVIVPTEVRDTGMDPDAAGVGPLVDDLKMAETR
jgi:hypothetical protein